MTVLDRLIATPRLLEVDHIDVGAPPDRAWEAVRHGNLGRSPLIRALFAVRTLPSRLAGHAPGEFSLYIDDLQSTAAQPGFHVLVDDPPHEVAVGAIGQVWLPDIPFVHLTGAEAFAAFASPGFAKVAWSIRVVPRGDAGSRIEVEVRVDTTDEESWKKFRRYFRIIGIGSRFIRHSALSSLAHELGAPDEQPLEGDDLLPDAVSQDTRSITIAAPPEEVWPWLLQMGCGRGGYYAIDLLDNANVRSARELHPDWARIRVGDVLPATPGGQDGFEVLRLEAPRALVLGGLFDPDAERQLPFSSARPRRYWQVTWAFVLEPLGPHRTQLHVRGRVAFEKSERLHAAWMRWAHVLMETAQLHHLAARAEGRLPRDDWRDVAAGVGGAAIMAAALFTPFLRRARNHWGLPAELAERSHPGDDLVREPRWTWTHGVEIAAPVEAVWPWVAQIGADRGGFYSYQWLENLAGCALSNAERIHPEWQARVGDALRLHPNGPALWITSLEPGRFLVAHGAPDEEARAAGKPWAEASWLFYLEPLGNNRCRLVSRFRVACSDDLASRLKMGPLVMEPIGFAMDRRMLLGIKQRAEQHVPPLRHIDEACLQKE